jgi:hypothetical protein
LPWSTFVICPVAISDQMSAAASNAATLSQQFLQCSLTQ